MSNGTKRPTSALALGLISIALGALGICGGLFSLTMQAARIRLPNAPQIPADVQSLLNLLQGFRVLLHVVLIVSGIGLIRVRNWGRILSMVYAVADIPATLASACVTAKMVLPAAAKVAPPNVPPGAMEAIMFVSLGAGATCGLIYPIVLLVMLNLKSVREPFTRSASAPPPISHA